MHRQRLLRLKLVTQERGISNVNITHPNNATDVAGVWGPDFTLSPQDHRVSLITSDLHEFF